MDLDPNDTVATRNRTFNFIINEFSTSGFISDKDNCNRGIFEASVDQLFNFIITFLFSLFPK